MIYTQEYPYEEIINLVRSYPAEIKKGYNHNDLQEFNKYLANISNITKKHLVAYILYNYSLGDGMFALQELSDCTIDAFSILELDECISLIRQLYFYYGNGTIVLDTPRVFIGLYTGKMTVQNVLDEETEENSKRVKSYIEKYKHHLELGISFEFLYFDILDRFQNPEIKTDTSCIEDTKIKTKAFFCAHHNFFHP